MSEMPRLSGRPAAVPVRRRARPLALVGTLAALLFTFVGDTSSPSALTPGVPRALAGLIRRGSATQWTAYAEQNGIRPFLVVYEAIVSAAPIGSFAEHERYWRAMEPTVSRLEAFVRARTGRSIVGRDYRAIRAGGLPTYRARRQAWNRVLELEGPGDLDTSTRIRSLRALMPVVDSLGTPQLRGRIRAILVYLYARLQDHPAMYAYAVAAHSWALECEQPLMECELVGVLGQLELEAGRRDSTLAWWVRGWQLAHRYDLPDQQARFGEFIASYEHERGRHAAAQRWHERTLRILDRYDLGSSELALLEGIGRSHVRLGAWDAAGRIRERLATALERLRRAPHAVAGQVILNRLEGDLAFHAGDAAAGDQSYSEVLRLDRLGDRATRHPEFFAAWARGLIRSRRFERALEVIEDGTERARFFPELAGELELLEARALLSRGRLQASRRALCAFDSIAARSTVSTSNRIARDVLAARLELAEGGPGRALAATAAAIGRVQAGARATDASAQSYVWLEQCSEIRSVLHDALGRDALARYGAECVWSDVQGWLGAAGSARASGSPASWATAQDFRRIGRKAVAAIPPGSVHLRYVSGPQVTVRFTVTSSSVVLDTLVTPSASLSAELGQAATDLARGPDEPGDGPPASLVKTLTDLGTALLPETVRSRVLERGAAGSPPLVFVSGDHAITAFPFEALNLGTAGRYDPLAEHADVAYLRRLGSATYARAPSAMTRSLVVANPRLPSELSRRLGLFDDLRAAGQEARSAARWLKPADVFTGPAATRSTLLAHWERCRAIVIAAHVLRSSDSPLLASLPLAPEDGTDAGGTDVDLNDVGQADLRHCELAVLSGCSTGAPYLGGEHPAPSFADVFVDAGARAAIWTFWDVRDERAAVTTGAMLSRWRGEGLSPVRAMGEARRALRREWPHPHDWAAYGIELASPSAAGPDRSGGENVSAGPRSVGRREPGRRTRPT